MASTVCLWALVVVATIQLPAQRPIEPLVPTPSQRVMSDEDVDEFAAGAVRITTPGAVMPIIKKKVDPKITIEAYKARVFGRVIIAAVVGVDGRIEKSQVYESVERSLDNESLKTLAKWRFVPARLNGVPVRFLVMVQMEFLLR